MAADPIDERYDEIVRELRALPGAPAELRERVRRLGSAADLQRPRQRRRVPHRPHPGRPRAAGGRPLHGARDDPVPAHRDSRPPGSGERGGAADPAPAQDGGSAPGEVARPAHAGGAGAAPIAARRGARPPAREDAAASGHAPAGTALDIPARADDAQGRRRGARQAGPNRARGAARLLGALEDDRRRALRADRPQPAARPGGGGALGGPGPPAPRRAAAARTRLTRRRALDTGASEAQRAAFAARP